MKYYLAYKDHGLVTESQRLVGLIKILYSVKLYYQTGQEQQFTMIRTNTEAPFISEQSVKIQPSIFWWHQELTINIMALTFGIPSNLL